jgi:NAD(P)-dependent dehydrogenase (short-subunit alcohol dehydrogenase family)
LLKLKGRTAVVTGAAGGIGRAIAASLARRGCNVALADIDDTALAHAANEIAEADVRISRHRLEVADRAAVAAFPERVIAEHGGVDILVNNTALRSSTRTGAKIPIRDFSITQWRRRRGGRHIPRNLRA